MAVTIHEWLQSFDLLAPERNTVEQMLVVAEETGDYYRADEAAANLNEKLADLADHAADIFRGMA